MLMVDVAQLVESRIVIPVVVGSSPIVHPKIQVSGPLAQLVEQLTLNQLVVSSNLTRPTNSQTPTLAVGVSFWGEASPGRRASPACAAPSRDRTMSRFSAG